MKNKKIYLLGGLIIIVLGVILFFIFNNTKEETDGERFTKEYPEISEDNVFVYKDVEEIITILKHGTGVVYLGFPECPWCQTYAKYLNEVAKEVGLEKIYYYNILEDRTNNTEEYQEIVGILEEHLQYDDEGNARIYVPNVSFHIDGEIIGNDYETSKDTHGFDKPSEYWTEEEVTDLKTTLKTYMQEVNTASNMCTSCNK